MTEPVAPSSDFARLASGAIRSWARISTRMWRNGIELYQVPWEFAVRENRSLGVWYTTIYFPPVENSLVRLRCTSITRPPSTAAIEVNLVVSPQEFAGTTKPRAIRIAMPCDAGPGVYDFTLRDDISGTTFVYRMPFGVPGGRS